MTMIIIYIYIYIFIAFTIWLKIMDFFFMFIILETSTNKLHLSILEKITNRNCVWKSNSIPHCFLMILSYHQKKSLLPLAILDYSNEYFVVLHTDRTKQHLLVLEAIYILFNTPSLCKQTPKHSLDLLGNISCLTLEGFNFFSPLCLAIIFHFHPLFT